MFRPIGESCVYFKVEIGLLHDLPLAQLVATEPLSSDDWEIIVRIAMLLGYACFSNGSIPGNTCYSR